MTYTLIESICIIIPSIPLIDNINVYKMIYCFYYDAEKILNLYIYIYVYILFYRTYILEDRFLDFYQNDEKSLYKHII